jgi:Cdc6-like AAA superfamily ATPase
MNHTAPEADSDIKQIIADFQSRTGLRDVDYEVKQRSDGQLLILKMANPTDRFYRSLTNIVEEKGFEQIPTPTIKVRAPANRLQSPEAKYFLRMLAESLNINRFSFRDEFFERYTNSVSNAEAQITAAANHIVYGRRGAGKSSLLLYAMRRRELERLQSAWIDMQTYQQRRDSKVVLEILADVMNQLKAALAVSSIYPSTVSTMARLQGDANLTDDTIRKFLPQVRTVLSAVDGNAFIFLDDFHLLDQDIQSIVLGFLYSVSRGNNIFLKLSAIETLSKPWDPKERIGLQVPHDAQTIKLDYNLTMPDKAASHIEGILDAHAIYCGLPSVRFLCTDQRVLSRLVWVSAGVPRDALNMFTQAMTKAVTVGRSRVTVTDVNMAASETVEPKSAGPGERCCRFGYRNQPGFGLGTCEGILYQTAT